LKTGHALTAEYLKWTGSQISDGCWFCESGAVQTREHLLQQADPWVEIRKKTGKPKRRWNMAKLFADARCCEAILAFLGKTEVGLKRRCDEVGWGGGSVSSREERRFGEEE